MDYYLGEIILFAGTFAPRGTSYCQGQLLAIQTNTALFSLLGTTYGGNGQTTFALPNLAGRTPVGTGNAMSGAYYSLGQIGGHENITLSQLNLPSHTHGAISTVNIPAVLDDGNTNEAGPSAIFAVAPTGTNIYSNATADSNLKPITANVTVQPTGGSQPVDNMMPYLAMNYCIVTSGIYPSRN